AAYAPHTGGPTPHRAEEFSQINQASPVPLLDTPDRDLPAGALDAATRRVYDDLRAKLESILASQPECPGDGNIDGVVDAKDLEEWRRIAHDWGLSSVYDFMVDGVFGGLTHSLDAALIQNNLGKLCERSYGVCSAEPRRPPGRCADAVWRAGWCRCGMGGAWRRGCRAGPISP